jgi:argininosuccinate lyase
MKSDQNQVWGSHLQSSPVEENVLFCAGRDVQSLPMADVALLPYDLWTNRAHSIMWHEEGVLPKGTLKQILKGLEQLEEFFLKGDFELDPKLEDVHINVEAFVTKQQGVEVGGWMHIGRSRNDQAACDTRLYLRNALLRKAWNLEKLIQTLLTQAGEHTETVMPGLTHYQPGMLTSWGHWLCAHAQALIRDLERVKFLLIPINRNPLGAAASFGTSWCPNRTRTTELMAFAEAEINTLDCISARGELESQVAQVYSAMMNHLSLLAQDLIFLSHPYINMLHLPDAFVTGSSIMPQKKNPDFAEVVKGKTALAHGLLQSLLGVPKGMVSGYNRDSQVSKYLVMDVIRECEPALNILSGVISELEVRKEVMRNRCNEGFMNAVDLADSLSRNHGIPFRKCYHLLAKAVRLSAPSESITKDSLRSALDDEQWDITFSNEDFAALQNPLNVLKRRDHLGSPNPKRVLEQIELMQSRLTEELVPIKLLKTSCEEAQTICRNYQA